MQITFCDEMLTQASFPCQINAEQKIPPLVIDVIARLSSFLRTLQPGLIQDERTIGDRLSQGREYLELIQVIGRAEARIIAGLEPFPKLCHSQKDEPIASSEQVDFGFHVKVKKAKDKGVKNGYKARSSVVDMEKALQAADEDFLKRGGYPLPTDLTDISNLKACARRRLARVYIVSNECFQHTLPPTIPFLT